MHQARWIYLQQFMYFLPCTGDESVLFGNTLINIREDEESRTSALSGDEGTLAEFPHEGLDSLHVSFALLDTSRKALEAAKNSNYYPFS